MNSVLLAIFVAVLVNLTISEECKVSILKPVPKFDLKKLSGHWNTYMRYKNVFQENDTCAYCDITYKPCQDKYQLVSTNFVCDSAARPRSAWVDVTGSKGVFNLKWDDVGIPKIYVTYVDYEKLALLEACYKDERIVMFVIRGKSPDADVKDKIKQLVKERLMDQNQLHEM